jgi:hypothetical protein
VTVRVRFADLRSVTRSVTLDAPISATVSIAEIAEDLVRAALADHPEEKAISLVAISVSHLESDGDVQLELPLGLEDEKRRPGAKAGMGAEPPTGQSTKSATVSGGRQFNMRRRSGSLVLSLMVSRTRRKELVMRRQVLPWLYCPGRRYVFKSCLA